MRYTVDWEQPALDALTSIWLFASDRNAVTTASNRADRELAIDPDKKGTDFYGDRLLLVFPLQVTYRVDVADRKVRGLDVYPV